MNSASCNLLINLCIYTFSHVACPRAIYLALIVDVDIIYGFLLYQETTAPFR